MSPEPTVEFAFPGSWEREPEPYTPKTDKDHNNEQKCNIENESNEKQTDLLLKFREVIRNYIEFSNF
jgi:hypothetical protein